MASLAEQISCPYPYCDEPREAGEIACSEHVTAEAARRAKIAAAKRGKPRSAEVRAKISAAQAGKRHVERDEDWATLEEMFDLSGHRYRLLHGWALTGDAPCKWSPRPGKQPDALLFHSPTALERLKRTCVCPSCHWPALVDGERCINHQDAEDVRASLRDLADHAGVDHQWLGKLLHAVRPELDGKYRRMTRRDLDELLAAQPRCRCRGCENPAGSTGACWVKGHYAWLRWRPELQKFGRGSEERQCAGEDCEKILVLRGYQLARGTGTRCASCTVKHLFSEPRWKARWYEGRWKSTKWWGRHGGRPPKYTPEQAVLMQDYLERGMSLRQTAIYAKVTLRVAQRFAERLRAATSSVT